MRKKMSNKFFSFLGVLFCVLSEINSQTDNLFWFAAPDISQNHGNPPGNGCPIILHITAVHATTVTIDMPANPSFTPLVFTLGTLQHQSIRLDSIINIAQIENYPLRLFPLDPMQNKGFRIRSAPGEITCYYEMDNIWNREIISLKGRNALGTQFYVSTQNQFDGEVFGGEISYSGFVIVATEANTNVTVYRNDEWFNFPGTSSPVIIHFDYAGQTFAFRALSHEAVHHINGVRVVSDKNIAITIYDDSMRKLEDPPPPGGTINLGHDTFADQIIPINLIGKEYLVVKGEVSYYSEDGGEKIFVTAVQNNSQIYIDGLAVGTPINAGQVFVYEITNNTTHVSSNNPVYVNHISGYGTELGGALLPTIDDCAGSNSITFTRSLSLIDSFKLNLMVRNDTNLSSPEYNLSTSSFTITCNGTTLAIPSSFFDYVINGEWAVLRKTDEVQDWLDHTLGLLPGDEILINNEIARFHLGIIQGSNTAGCKYAYFSNYYSEHATAGIGGAHSSTMAILCDADSVQLVAEGGKSYIWECWSDSSKNHLIKDTTDADPYFYPDSFITYVFHVTIQQACYQDSVITLMIQNIKTPIADFEIVPIGGQGSNIVQIKNLTDQSLADNMFWEFENPYTQVDQDTMSMNFDWTFDENTGEEIIYAGIRLYARSHINECSSIKEDSIPLLPFDEDLRADFTSDKTNGFSPMKVTFTNTSFGLITDNIWIFKDGDSSNVENPSHTFFNTTDTVLAYNVVLKVFRDEIVDSIVKVIKVYPSIIADYKMDKEAGCSPLKVSFTNTSLGTVTNNLWVFGDEDYSYHPNTSHTFINSTDTIVNYNVTLVAFSDEITDSITKTIYVFPTAVANFTVDTSTGLSPFTPVITNQSTNADRYFWNFNDGSNSVEENPVHTFNSENNQKFNVSLIVNNTTNCMDTFSMEINALHVSSLNENSKSDPIIYFDKKINELVLLLPSSVKNNLVLTIHDLTGRIVFSKKISVIELCEVYKIDLGNKVTGNFIVNLISKEYSFSKLFTIN